jgi:probable F420-dependent oxidoreductase
MSDRRIGLTIPLEGISPQEGMIPIARLAEESGYTDIWSAEVGGTDGFAVLAAAATATEKVRLGTAIVPVFSRPPALIAMGAATVDALSGGRFVLGIGTSTSIIIGNWMGIPFERPLTRVKETVEILREAFSGKKVSFDGETVQSTGFRLSAELTSPPPIYIAALGPKMIELAGRVADGLILFLFTPEGARDAIERFRAAARDAGRNPDELDVVARIPAALDEDEETLRFMMRRLTTTYAMVDVYNASLRRQGFEAESKQIAELWRAGDRDGAAGAVSDQMLDGLYIFGDLDQCSRRISEFREAGIRTPVLLPVSVVGDPTERTERIRKAIPALASA